MLCIRGDEQEADYQVTLWEGEYPSRIALCKPCFEMYEPNVPMTNKRRIERRAGRINPVPDWYRILRQYGLPEDITDLRVIVSYERDNTVVLLGVYVVGAYRLLYVDTGMLVTFGHVQDEAGLCECCKRFAENEDATLVT